MSDDQDDPIFRVDTVPPPAGESDAYNAPTKVGPMAAAVVEEMMHASVRKAAELSQRAEEKKSAHVEKEKAGGDAKPSVPAKASASPVSGPPTASAAPGSASRSPPRVGSGYSLGPMDLIQDVIPASSPPSKPAASPSKKPAASPPISEPPARLYDDHNDDDDDAATMLSRAAKAPLVEPIAHPPAPFLEAPFAAPAGNSGAGPSASPPSPSSTPVASPFGSPPAPAHRPPESAPVLWFPVAVGFAIFFVGVVLYLWAR